MPTLIAAAHSLAFKVTMKLHVMRGIPAMTTREREVAKAVLLGVPHEGELRVFEWGSGFSTPWIAKCLSEAGIPFHIDSIDNHQGWHERVREMLKSRGLDGPVTLHLREFVPCWDKPGWDWAKTPECGRFAPSSQNELEYIELPKTLGKHFDVMFVDARFRRRCLEVASECISPLGIVVLHDAQKTWYHPPSALFERSNMIDGERYYPLDNGDWKIWVGSHGNSLVDSL